MMTRSQLLLLKLAEEAAEVSQIALKAAQFGLGDVWEKVAPLTVSDRLHAELNDLLGIVSMLNHEFGLGFVADPAQMAAKAGKVNRYYDLSVSMGLVEPRPPVVNESLTPASAPRADPLAPMVDRFLAWRLPEDFAPDCFITFDREATLSSPHSWPVGTNLFTATQARAMLEHVVFGPL